MSVKPSARSSSSATYCGAPQIVGLCSSRTVVVSSAPSAAGTGGARRRTVPPAIDTVARKRRRGWVITIGSLSLPRSRLQLAFELVQETPIGAVGDDLVRARLDHAGLVQAQRIK